MGRPDDDVGETVPIDVAGAGDAGAELCARLLTQDHGVGAGGVRSDESSGAAEEDEGCPLIKQSTIYIETPSAHDDVVEAVPIDVAGNRYRTTKRCRVKPENVRMVRLQHAVRHPCEQGVDDQWIVRPGNFDDQLHALRRRNLEARRQNHSIRISCN